MPWFIDEMINNVKKIPSVVENLLSSEITYTKPEPQVATVMETVEATQPTNILEGEWQGTNYDPYDVWQNRPDATEENVGLGAAGVRVAENMVAVSRKKGSDEAMLRLGTVLRNPESGEQYLVADLMNRRFDGQNKIDFATPKTGKEISEKYNRTFSGFEVVRDGGGYEDVREFVESGEWDKMKQSSNKN